MTIKVDRNTVIVFDLDDTLYNEIDYLKSAYQDIAKSIRPENWKNCYAQLFSWYRMGKNVFDLLVGQYNCDKTKLVEQYRNHKPLIAPFAGVIQLMEQIHEKEGKTAIITDGRSVTQRNKINALGLESLLDFIVISGELGTEKPNENNFKVVEEHFKRSNHYYIADNLKKDFIAPNALGWHSIALIDNGLNIHKENAAYLKPPHLPNEFILDIREIRVR